VCTVLIVDDDVDTREALAGLLRGQGHSVLLAMNGSHALELLELGRSMGAEPCVALLDLMMPVMDGWAFLAALDRDGSWRRLRVIVSSGSDLSARPLSFAQPIEVWPKPIDLRNLAHIQDRCPVHDSARSPKAHARGPASPGGRPRGGHRPARPHAPREVGKVTKPARKRESRTH
jgi:CheY-like chemotaxis protein